MPRAIPESRLQDLLECATRVFLEQGYRRTQITDVAAALGVAKGTVYLYVESKEALFDAAFRYADRVAPAASEVELPLRALDPDAGAHTNVAGRILGIVQGQKRIAGSGASFVEPDE